MAGTLVIDTLNASTGPLSTNNGMSGIAKAWVQFVGSTASINGSFNVSSVTRNGSGDFTVNFTTAMSNANYCTVGSGNLTSNGGNLPVYCANTQSSSPYYNSPSTTSVRGCFYYSLGSGTATQDPYIAQIIVIGT